MLLRLKKLKNCRAGLSLIELLIAVVILAVAAAPLLHAFVTSANILGKSRLYGEATMAAQNVQEVIEQSTVTAVVEGSAGVQSLLGADSISKVDDLSCEIAGLAEGSRSYDARVTFDASNAINSRELIQYTDMDAAFAQSYLQTDNPDTLAMNAFQAEHASYSNLQCTRSITVDVSHEDPTDPGTLSADKVWVKITYLYAFSYDEPAYDADGIATGGITSGPLFTYSKEYALFPNGSSYTDDTTAPLSVYIMYYPYYDAVQDTVNVNNTEDIPLTLFLVKQRSLQLQADGSFLPMEDAALTTAEAAHITEINQYQSTGYTGDWCSLYTNAGSNLGSGSAAVIRYRIFRGTLWYTSAAGDLSGQLAATAAADRYYNVTIEIYRGGTGLAGDPLYTMSSSKLK